METFTRLEIGLNLLFAAALDGAVAYFALDPHYGAVWPYALGMGGFHVVRALLDLRKSWTKTRNT